MEDWSNVNSNDRNTKAPFILAVIRWATSLGLLLCSSCSTPPSPESGLVGIIYHAVKRPENGRVLANATPVTQPLGGGQRGTEAPLQQEANEHAVPQGPPSYRISPGDVLAVSYFARPTADVTEYLIDSQDVLTISVSGQDVLTADVTVRPDGCISFYLTGELRVRGKTVAQVRAEIAQRVSRRMPGAEVTVILKAGNALAREFLDTLRSNTDLGSTRIIQVRQDGSVTFPLIGEVRAVGKTLAQLSCEIERRYDEVFRGGISLALNLNSSSEGNIAVLGEVRNPGRYTINGPTSPFFALAMAGGALDTAKKSQVVVVKRHPDGSVAWHIVNTDLESGRPLGPEIALLPQDMLLVPKKGVASLNVFVDQYIRQMLPVGVGYGRGDWSTWMPTR